MAHKDSARWDDLAASVDSEEEADPRKHHVKINLLTAHTRYNQWLMAKWNPMYRDKQDINTTSRSVVLNIEAKAEAKQASQAIDQLLHPPQ